MKRILLSLAIGAFAASTALAGTAIASGPAAPGKRLVEVTCEGLGTITVSLAPNERAKGAGQVVGQKAHGIPAATTFTVTDVTTGTVVFSETETRGGGNAHHNQNAIACKGAPIEEEASSFFGEEGLPPGVSPSDIIRAEFEVHVILKP
jgi:hypothetical protein